MGARQTALGCLIACRRQGAWSDGVLKEHLLRDRLDRREAALAARLCYGVLQNRALLDYHLSGLVKGRLKDLQPVVLDILRLGLYQILWMDKIPPSAAVNESVELGKKYANARAAGLINGVLRAALRRELPLPPDLATRYSHPQALVDLLAGEMSEAELEMVLAADNQAPETVVQVNPLAGTMERLRQSVEAVGGTCRAHPWLPGCCTVSGAGNLEEIPGFAQGLFYVQDAASRLAVRCAGLRPGMAVLDCCAAPGGKSFAAAIDLENQGSVTACDIHPHKIGLLERGAQRLGLSCIHPMQHDARAFAPAWEKTMDAVLVDVPCSGLGIIRKKPDIRYKDLEKIGDLPALQLEILQNQSHYVKPGGVLLYSTCTILRRENQAVVEAFLAEALDFVLEPLPAGPVRTGMVRLLPGQFDTDGFFIAKLRRKT